jgi:mannan endo-1,4-beta-mannosidase
MTRRKLRLFGISLILAIAASLSLTASTIAKGGPGGNDFVRRAGPHLMLKGKQFRFAGTNNYYLMYKSHLMVDDVLATAAGNDLNVVRTWGFLDIGNQDGSNSTDGKKEGVYFQYWDGTAPAYNDGPDGLEKLDYIVYKAGLEGVRLVIPLTNNWRAFGGIDQYVKWAGGQYHSDFYTNPQIKQWYKNWISHVLNRTNTLTGKKYKDDPTIMMWELGNEPRCKGDVYPAAADCTTKTLLKWADEMSRFISKTDKNHLVAMGDEGFYCDPKSTATPAWVYNCGEGIDTIALTKLPAIDVMSFHLYPDHWGTDAAWGTKWIKQHLQDAKKLDKPAILGEFGWIDKATRNPVFKEWTDTVYFDGGAGAMYWILSGKQDDGILYPDYDGFTVYANSPVFITLGNFADVMMGTAAWSKLPPVADNDNEGGSILTGESLTLNPADNDVAYGVSNAVVLSTIDLDPATAGQQTELDVAGGHFALDGSGAVTFTSTAGWTGDVIVQYTIADKLGRVSNQAKLSITVLPIPGEPFRLFDFEVASELTWRGGTVGQSPAFASHGSFGLAITGSEGWYEYDFATPVDMSSSTGYTAITVDAWGPAGWGYSKIGLKTGSGWSQCESPGVSVDAGGPKTFQFNLLTMGCSNLNDVRAFLLYSKGGVDTGVDNIWVK